MVPALVILALWTALLGPGVVRWLRQHTPTTSIASFHRQLRGLEHSGPKLVEAANRVGDADRTSRESQRQRRETERPRLVLLRTGANQKESTMHDGRYDDEYVDPWADRDAAVQQSWDDPWTDPFDEPSFEDPRIDPPTRSLRTVRTPQARDYPVGRGRAAHGSHMLAKDRAQHRRTRILFGLGGAILGTFLLGLIPALSILWALTVLGVVAMAAYLGLMYYASNIGLYGRSTSTTVVRRTPIARAVMPAIDDSYEGYDLDDEDWRDERVAAAR